MDVNDGNPTESQPGSGFTFNFQIPASVKQTCDTEPKTLISEGTPGSESTADSKPKPKEKKKKKKAGRGEESVPENKTREEVPKQESAGLTPEQQLSQELDWCIEQLELGLRTQKSSTKQKEEAARALKTLRSSKAPIVKKRQVMRAVSGDYRKKMDEDRERQHRLICSAMSSAKVAPVCEARRTAVYHRSAETRRPPANDASLPAEQTYGGAEDRFVFRASGEEFRFNFSL